MWLQTVTGYDLSFESELWLNFADLFSFLFEDKTRRGEQIG
jgi:hypothetical protein